MHLLIPLVIALQSAPAFLRTPDIYGDMVVFSCEGDLWLGSVSSGQATRITRDEGVEIHPRFSPDGKWIAFAGEYDGVREIYVMSTDGGAPRRVTFRNAVVRAIDWSPDGKTLLFRAPSGSKAGYVNLFTVPVAGGAETALPLERADTGGFAPTGNKITFTRNPRATEAWFRYQGGTKNDIWVGDLDKSSFTMIYKSKFTNEYPIWAGDKIYFAHDEGDGSFSVMSVQPDGGGAKRAAGPYDYEVRALQTDGSKVVYEKGIGLAMLDLKTGKDTPLSFELLSDRYHTRPFLAPAEKFVTGGSIGPTGKRVYVETRGQIVSLPAKDGDARVVMGKSGVRFRDPAQSPDAKKLAYVSDETREQQLYVADPDGKNPKQLTTDANRQILTVSWSPDSSWIAITDSDTMLTLVAGDGSKKVSVAKGWWWNGPPYTFSPDSKWIVYRETVPFSQIGRLVLFEIATGKKTPLGPALSDDDSPSFSSDGKWLAFLSKRNIAPEGDAFLNQLNTAKPMKAYLLALKADTASPFKIESDEESSAKKAEEKKDEKKETPPFTLDVDGLYDRLIAVPVPAGTYNSIAVVGERVILGDGSNITFYDLKTKTAGTITTGSAFEVSADGKKLLVTARDAGRIVDVTATDAKPTENKISFGNLQLQIDPVQEWEQIYWDSWRLLRDYFYVPNMHGADWPKIGAKYAAMLPSVRSRDELTELIRWMQSELATGHMYRGEGDTQGVYKPSSPAFLGIDVAPDPSGYYKITKIFRGDGYESSVSPLSEQGLGVKEGDFLIEIGGIQAKVGSNYLAGLVGRAGQPVAVRINTRPSADGARTVIVKPISDEQDMRYREWVRANREYVAKKSGGRVGYIHLAAMGNEDVADFIKQYFPQRDREALIIDDRFNGGGYVSTFIINVLKQKLIHYFNGRATEEGFTRQNDYFPGPMVCLMNEFSGSCGEEFPNHFRKLGLGPLIGKRTWGGEVGSSPGWPLIDGGMINVPNYGAWSEDEGWIIESTGVSPDIEVDSDPNAYVKGIDPQLDKGVEYLLAELRKHPVKRPKQPDPPVRAKPRP